MQKAVCFCFWFKFEMVLRQKFVVFWKKRKKDKKKFRELHSNQTINQSFELLGTWFFQLVYFGYGQIPKYNINQGMPRPQSMHNYPSNGEMLVQRLPGGGPMGGLPNHVSPPSRPGPGGGIIPPDFNSSQSTAPQQQQSPANGVRQQLRMNSLSRQQVRAAQQGNNTGFSMGQPGAMQMQSNVTPNVTVGRSFPMPNAGPHTGGYPVNGYQNVPQVGGFRVSFQFFQPEFWFKKFIFELRIKFKIKIMKKKIAVGSFLEGVLCENSQFLWHTHETQGPMHKHITLSYATTLYGFPIETIQCWRSELWLPANLILDGNVNWSTPVGMWKCDSPRFDTAISQFFSSFFSKFGFG